MAAQISKDELVMVKKTIDDAENGRGSLSQLARAHDVCERAGASQSLGIIRDQIRRYTPESGTRQMGRQVFVGVVSGSIVWFLLGRRASRAS